MVEEINYVQKWTRPLGALEVHQYLTAVAVVASLVGMVMRLPLAPSWLQAAKLRD